MSSNEGKVSRLSFMSKGPTLEEQALERKVQGMLFDGYVMRYGQGLYGLKWRFGSADAPQSVIGSWLFQVNKDKMKKNLSTGKLSFFCLDDAMKELRQCKDELGTITHRKMNYAEIVAVRARKSGAGMVYIKIYHKKGNHWSMTPVQTDNEEIVIRWVAALRHRTGNIDPQMEADSERAERLALYLQSVVKMRKAIEKVDRMQKRRKGIMNQLGNMLYGIVDTDSEYDDSDEEETKSAGSMQVAKKKNKVEEPASPFLVTFVSALAADLYDTTFGSSEPEREKIAKEVKHRSVYRPKTTAMEEEKKIQILEPEELKHSSSYLQDAYTLPPLEPYEVEDELWENERWQIGAGWGRESLFPTDRAPFTDRIGRGNFKSLDDVEWPEGWDETFPWTLDTSGQTNGMCGDNGWTYGLDFPPVDASLARGKPMITKTMGSAVRRRRWFRRRIPHRKTRIESPVIWSGWLGRKSSGSGRWQSRFFALTRGLRLHGKITGVALSYFRYSCETHLDFVGSSDLENWNRLTGRELRTWNLDGAYVMDKDNMDHLKAQGPYMFEVRMATEQAKLVAMSAEAREHWVGAIEFAVKDQVKRFTLTKSLELPNQLGSFMEVSQYQNHILDRLIPIYVDDAFDMFFRDEDFRKEFYERCKFKLVSNSKWSKNAEANSRREIVYKTPKKSGGFEVIKKEKIVRSSPGEGFQIDASMQSVEAPFGNIYQDELRMVLANWKDKATRVFISHRVNLRTEDESVVTFVESNARSLVLDHHIKHWLPFVQKTLKNRRKKETEREVSSLKIASPVGIEYQVDREKKGLKAVDPSFKY